MESKITWDKLVLELELLSAEDPTSLVPILIGVHTVLWPSDVVERSQRTLNFMTYDLARRCEGYEEADRFHILNDFFFDDKGFQIRFPKKQQLVEDDFLMKSILERRVGTPLSLACLYLHFASHVDLPIYLVQVNTHFILKWVRGGKCCYIDLLSNGKLLTENEMLQIFNRPNARPSANHESPCQDLDILPSKFTLTAYLNELKDLYTQLQRPDQLLTVYNLLLTIDNSNLKTLSERALLHKRLGYGNEALADIKRYFSFVGQDQAPGDLQMAFFELNSFTGPDRKSTDFLH